MAIRAARARASWERGACGLRCVVWVRRGPVTRPSKLRHAVSGDRPTDTAATHAGARSRSHDAGATQLSVSQTRDTHSTHSVRTAQQCSMCRMSNTARSPGSRVEFGSQSWPAMAPPEARGMAANAHKRGCLHRRGRMLRMLTDVTEWYTTSFARVPCCCLLAW
jgi:hypothetical protein